MASPSGWSTRLRMALACVWSTNLCGRKACSKVSTEGFGAAGSSRFSRWTRTMSSSVSSVRARSLRRRSRRTAGSPAGSIAAMSAPEPLTQSTATSSPRRSGMVVFTEVLPPPCSTNLGSRPSRRVV